MIIEPICSQMREGTRCEYWAASSSERKGGTLITKALVMYANLWELSNTYYWLGPGVSARSQSLHSDYGYCTAGQFQVWRHLDVYHQLLCSHPSSVNARLDAVIRLLSGSCTTHLCLSNGLHT